MAGSSRDGRGRGRWDDWDDWDWEGWQDDKKEHSKARKAWGPRSQMRYLAALMSSDCVFLLFMT